MNLRAIAEIGRVAAFSASLAAAAIALGSNCSGQSADLEAADLQVAATVANQTISVRQAETLFTRICGDRTLNEESKTILRAKALEQLVGQLLVNEYLRGAGMLASDADVQLSQERLEGELNAVEQSFDQYLTAQGLTRNEWLDQQRFRLSWSRYLDATLTEANLKKHFEQNRRGLDGSQVRVSHILLASGDSPDSVRAAQELGGQIRQEIMDGTITWPDAVRKYSQGESRNNGGELGWLERSAPMPEPFSQAAFALEPGQISPPTRTVFGVHLIRCEEVKPGELTWEQVEPAVRKHAVRYLFDWVVARQTPVSPPKYSGRFPHWDAQTDRAIAADSDHE